MQQTKKTVFRENETEDRNFGVVVNKCDKSAGRQITLSENTHYRKTNVADFLNLPKRGIGNSPHKKHFVGLNTLLAIIGILAVCSIFWYN